MVGSSLFCNDSLSRNKRYYRCIIKTNTKIIVLLESYSVHISPSTYHQVDPALCIQQIQAGWVSGTCALTHPSRTAPDKPLADVFCPFIPSFSHNFKWSTCFSCETSSGIFNVICIFCVFKLAEIKDQISGDQRSN